MEDPAGFKFKGINRIDINNAVGMTFPQSLRAFLRQAPDIIMVGEIRDLETAEMAIKAAVTKEILASYLVSPELEHYKDRDVIFREGAHDKGFFKLVQGALQGVKGAKISSKSRKPVNFFVR